MIEKTIKIGLDSGIDTRTAAKFSNIACKSSSSTWIKKGNVEVNGKSIMGIISLALSKNDEIILKISGSDEMDLMTRLSSMLA